MTVFHSYLRIFQFIQLIEFCWSLCVVFLLEKVRRRDGENIDTTKEKELFAVIVNLLPKEPKDVYHTTVLQQVNVQVQFL